MAKSDKGVEANLKDAAKGQQDKRELEKQVLANQKAQDSTLDGGIEIETSSLDFDSDATSSVQKPAATEPEKKEEKKPEAEKKDTTATVAVPPRVGLAQYSDVEEFGLLQLEH